MPLVALPDPPADLTGPGADIVRAWTDAAALYRLDGAVLVLGPWEDPLTGEVVAYVPWYAAGLGDAGRAALPGAAAEHLPECRRLVVRAPADDPSWSQVATVERVLVSKDCAGAAPPLHDTVTFRPAAGEADREAVGEMFRDALRRGYAGHEAGADAGDRLDALRADFVDGLRRGDIGAVVADLDGEVVGHAAWDPHGADEVTGAPVVDLVDVYVLPRLHGQGLARALTTAAEHAAAGLGRPLCSEVVYAGPADEVADGVLGNLLRSGWQRTAVLWSMPLPGGRRAVEQGGAA